MATATAKKPKPATAKAPDICRLIIEIGDTMYRVSPIPVRDFGARRAFRLKKDADTIHHVIEHIHGIECSCGDFVFRHDGKPTTCKHVRALKAVGLL